MAVVASAVGQYFEPYLEIEEGNYLGVRGIRWEMDCEPVIFVCCVDPSGNAHWGCTGKAIESDFKVNPETKPCSDPFKRSVGDLNPCIGAQSLLEYKPELPNLVLEGSASHCLNYCGWKPMNIKHLDWVSVSFCTRHTNDDQHALHDGCKMDSIFARVDKRHGHWTAEAIRKQDEACGSQAVLTALEDHRMIDAIKKWAEVAGVTAPPDATFHDDQYADTDYRRRVTFFLH